MTVAIVTGLLSLFGGWVGAVLGAYFKKKGENLATHEDIDKLVDQVAAVTQTTKEIETKISDAVWDRQKRWELKREVLFEATRALASVEDALVKLHSVMLVGVKEDDIQWAAKKLETTTKWNAAYSKFEEACLLMSTVCSKEAALEFETYGNSIVRVAKQIAGRNDGEIYKKTSLERVEKHLALRELVRKELGIDGVKG